MICSSVPTNDQCTRRTSETLTPFPLRRRRRRRLRRARGRPPPEPPRRPSTASRPPRSVAGGSPPSRRRDPAGVPGSEGSSGLRDLVFPAVVVVLMVSTGRRWKPLGAASDFVILDASNGGSLEGWEWIGFFFAAFQPRIAQSRI